jgi:hypothetical protein
MTPAMPDDRVIHERAIALIQVDSEMHLLFSLPEKSKYLPLLQR